MNRIYYSLYDRLLHRRALALAFAKVRRARGAPGVDGQTVADFQANVEDELTRLVEELRTKAYRPQPVRRVIIPKPGGGERKLGIPAVRDRVVQQVLLNILQPIFDPSPVTETLAPVKLRLSSRPKLPASGGESHDVCPAVPPDPRGRYGFIQMFRPSGS
jgi:hypothetical protein